MDFVYLQQACGYEFTNKLHQMFTDMTISKDLDKKFEDYYKNKDIDIGIGFSILVLQVSRYVMTYFYQFLYI